MKILVTGAAGFIGSSLTDRLLAAGHQVRGFDNFSTGQERFLESALQHPSFGLVRGDLLNEAEIEAAAKGCELVFHLAANADVRFGLEHPRKDLEQNTIATFNVLEAMRKNGVKRIAFSSTGSVYGEAKLAGEGMIAAYCEGFGMQGLIFRFVSILGERYTHGHVFDFYRQLAEDPKSLRVLGNGKQRKSYLYIQDCIDAMLLALEKAPSQGVSVFNLGVNAYVEVNDSIAVICKTLGLRPEMSYSGGERGWVGDNPFIFLDTAKIRALGWEPKHTIEQGVEKTVRFLQANEWVFGRGSQ